VHGLNGHPHRTWTSTRTGAFWPVDLLPEVLDQSRVRILTYGYNANVTSFTDGASKDRILNHSETLAAQLAANRTVSTNWRPLPSDEPSESRVVDSLRCASETLLGNEVANLRP
jgi:hypothetical protein